MKSRIVAAVLVAVFLSSCSQKQPEKTADATAGTQTATSDNVSELLNLQQMPNRTPEFSWKDASGNVVTFASARKKVTLVNFWATWCGPCKAELPDLIDLSKQYANKDVEFIGIATDRGDNVISDVRAFVKDKGIPYQIVMSNEDLEEAFGTIRAIPMTFIVDKDGKILTSFLGARSKDFFVQTLDKYLAQSGA
ncbi:MAG TPA: TlpA disulfide reductase family protein [Bacteroidota bacterium]|nr:TlpA disulfide reductase family protein [Bacteroidota bacterium]